MKKMLLAIVSIGLVTGPALAAQQQMNCVNPRQNYLVTFDPVPKTFILGTPGNITKYQVISIEETSGGNVVRGKTVADGPNFVAYLGDNKRIEFINGGEIIQTDICE